MCPKCNGLMVREKWFERVTGTSPCYYCVNCGNYVDSVITRNKAMSPQELAILRLNDTNEIQPGFTYLVGA